MPDRYRKFYSEYKNKLFSYLVYKSGDAEVSRDIMQESFTRHFQHYGQEAVISPSLLFTIARNALVDYQRNQGRFLRTDQPVPHEAGEEEAFIVREEVGQVREALNRLPEQDREMLNLAVGDVPYKEIAAIFDLSVANVKVRIHRARTRLRQMLNREV